MNVLSFTGNLGRDVNTNNVSGTAVANFTVAMKAGFGDKAETVWVDCALWGKRAEGGLIQYLTKGQQVAVTGEASIRTFEHNGETKAVITCRVNDVTLVGSKGDSQQPQQQSQPRQQQPAPQQQQAPAQQQAFGGQPQGGTANSGDWEDEVPF